MSTEPGSAEQKAAAAPGGVDFSLRSALSRWHGMLQHLDWDPAWFMLAFVSEVLEDVRSALKMVGDLKL